MDLTKRFFVQNALAVLASIAVTVLAVLLFLAVYTRWIGPEADRQELIRLFEIRSGIGEIKNQAAALSFEQLLDRHFQQELSDRMNVLGADAAIWRNREVLFATVSRKSADLDIMLRLTDVAPDADSFELEGKTYLFARTDYVLPSGDQGVLLLFAPVQLHTDFYLTAGVFTVGVFVLAFLLMNGWVSYRFSRSIIAPVSRLKDAAVKISEGDLSGGIAEEGEGEVRELSKTLELMRIKLKESVYLQQKYDDNRRFLMSSISHDLKTPVTSIKGYIEGILDGVAATPEKRKEYLEIARAKAELVNAMIDDLLLYAKLDLNQMPYHFERTNLTAYFEDCVADRRHEFEKANIRLTLLTELREPVFIRIDRERFGRVIQNIIDNAKKFMDKPDGRIDVVLRETRTSAIIEIRDNGRGIPEDQLPRIFERFYRADSSRKTAEGSGLGLAIAKQIVEGHEGKIWATSVPGEGTRVMISLRKE